MDIEPGRAIEATPAVVWTTTGDGRDDHANRRGFEHAGPDPPGAAGVDWRRAVISAESATQPLGSWEWVLASGQAAESETRLSRPGKSYPGVLLRRRPMCDHLGRVVE